MGLVYLTYAAYFLSTDVSDAFRMMTSMLVFLHVLLAWTYQQSAYSNMKVIDTYLNEMESDVEEEEPAGMQQSLTIKRTMLK